MRAALAVIGVVLVTALLVGAVYAIQWGTAGVRGNVAANEAIKADPQFRIEAYERFFNICASVQTIESTILASQSELQHAASPREQERIRTNITGLIAARADAVNQYNADSHKSYTAAQFKSSDLPFELPRETQPGGTSCVA